MFAIKKVTKVSVCWAMRCSNLASDKLCDRHQAEWLAAGSPALEYKEPAPKTSTGSAALALDEARQAALTTERAQFQQALVLAQTFPLRVEGDTPEASRARVEKATLIMNSAHEQAKALDAELDKLLDPLKDAMKVAKGWFKPNIDTLLAIKKTLSERIGEHQAMLVRERDAALAVIAAGAGSAPPSAFLAAHADVSAPAPLVETVEFSVTDVSLVPEEFWVKVLDQNLIKAAVKAGREVPGVTVTRAMKARIG